jgi:TonB family protein
MCHVIIPILGAILLASRVLGEPVSDSADVHTLKEAEAAAIHHPHPDYPLEARRQHLSGRGIVVGAVDQKTGKLESLKMEQSTGHALLDDAILRAFRQWNFKPGTIRRFHVPVSYNMVTADQLFKDVVDQRIADELAHRGPDYRAPETARKAWQNWYRIIRYEQRVGNWHSAEFRTGEDAIRYIEQKRRAKGLPTYDE